MHLQKVSDRKLESIGNNRKIHKAQASVSVSGLKKSDRCIPSTNTTSGKTAFDFLSCTHLGNIIVPIGQFKKHEYKNTPDCDPWMFLTVLLTSMKMRSCLQWFFEMQNQCWLNKYSLLASWFITVVNTSALRHKKKKTQKSQDCCVVIFTAALPRGSCDYSIYTKVASQALDCPFESISLPLLSCWCLRRQTARLHRASLRLSTTRAEGGDPLYRSLPSPSVPENDREEGNLKAHEVKKKKIGGKRWHKYWFIGCWENPHSWGCLRGTAAWLRLSWTLSCSG